MTTKILTSQKNSLIEAATMNNYWAAATHEKLHSHTRMINKYTHKNLQCLHMVKTVSVCEWEVSNADSPDEQLRVCNSK